MPPRRPISRVLSRLCKFAYQQNLPQSGVRAADTDTTLRRRFYVVDVHLTRTDYNWIYCRVTRLTEFSPLYGVKIARERLDNVQEFLRLLIKSRLKPEGV